LASIRGISNTFGKNSNANAKYLLQPTSNYRYKYDKMKHHRCELSALKLKTNRSSLTRDQYHTPTEIAIGYNCTIINYFTKFYF